MFTSAGEHTSPTNFGKGELNMKKRVLSLGLALALLTAALAGCGGQKNVSWKVTCPWAPSGVAAMVSQQAATKSTS